MAETMVYNKNTLLTLLLALTLGGSYTIYPTSTTDECLVDVKQTSLCLEQSMWLPKSELNLEEWNNINTEGSSSYLDDNGSKMVLWYDMMKNILSDISLDIDEDGFEKIVDLMNFIKNNESMSSFLRFVEQQREDKVIKAITLYYEQQEYQNIDANEENFIVYAIENGSLQTQESALNALYSLGKTSYIDRLRNIKIKNYYLQKDLDKFIAKQVG